MNSVNSCEITVHMQEKKKERGKRGKEDAAIVSMFTWHHPHKL